METPKDSNPTKVPELAESPAGLAERDFKRLLQETLIFRCKGNPAYSLRAFAKQLQIEPSFLSKLLSGKRNATDKLVIRLGPKLSLSPSEMKSYLSAPRKRGRGKRAVSDRPSFQNLAIDHFRIIADWHHYAILELISVRGFESDPSWIAKSLGIHKLEAQSALERLERLEMIAKDKDGKYSNTSGNHTTVGNEFTAVAFRKLQKQILHQALDALENLPIEERDHSSMTMAIDPALLPLAKKRIKEFRRELCSFLQENRRPKKQVYQLSLALFPVTKMSTEPKEKRK